MAAGSGGDAGARPQLLSSFLESTFPPCSAVLKIKSISLHAAQKRPGYKEGGVFVCVCERERERERERSLLTINRRLKVGKYCALTGNTASGRSGPSI